MSISGAVRAAAAGLLACVLAACARTAPQSASGAEASGTGSVVRFALAADPQTLNPLFAHVDAASVEQQVARLAFEPFVDVDERGQLIPVLLARVPTVANGDLSRDGRTIVYHLRRGVRWSDGAPVDAHDVVWTLHAILDDRNPVRSRAGYDRIANASAVDTLTVRVTLKAPWAPAVASIFGHGSAPQYVLPAHLLEHAGDLSRAPFSSHPVGDGPYTFVSWSRGERLVYAANAAYWRGAPRLARLDIRIVPDPNTDFTLMRGGELDWNLFSPAQRASLGATAGIAFRSVPTTTIAGVALNTRHAPLDDVRVRRAIAASIDRAAISAKITGGRYPVIDTAQPLGSWARDASVHEPAFDTAAADRALDNAGWRRGADGVRAKGGHRLMLTYVQFPESQTGVRVATFVQAALKDRGFDVAIKSLSNAQLFLPAAQGGTLAKGAFDLAYVPWPMAADPDDSALYACDGAENYARWCDPRVGALERRALSATDPGVRRAAYAQIERQAANAVPIVFLFDAAYSYAYRTSLSGFNPNAFDPTWDAYRWSIAP